MNLDLTTEDLIEQLKVTAYERATWAYRDVMIGFEEVGVMPTKQQKEAIIKELAKSKLMALLRKNNISWS